MLHSSVNGMRFRKQRRPSLSRPCLRPGCDRSHSIKELAGPSHSFYTCLFDFSPAKIRVWADGYDIFEKCAVFHVVRELYLWEKVKCEAAAQRRPVRRFAKKPRFFRETTDRMV